MFEKLESINWAALEHAYGSADDVPGQMRNLVSADIEERQEALAFFWGEVIHQGTVCSSAPYAIQFLLEVIVSPSGANRAELLELICAYASASTCPEYPGDESSVIDQCQRQVADAWREYLRLLTVSDERERCCLALALGYCKEHAVFIVDSLKHHLSSELSPLVTASILECIGKLAGAENVEYLAEFMKSSNDRLVSFICALSLIHNLNNDHWNQAAGVLVHYLTDTLAVDASYLKLPSSKDESGVAQVVAALCLTGKNLKGFLPDIRIGLNAVRENDTGTIGIAYSLLAYAFPDGEKYSGELSEIQYLVLELMAGSDRIWYWGNVILMFRDYDLPESREGLSELVHNCGLKKGLT